MIHDPAFIFSGVMDRIIAEDAIKQHLYAKFQIVHLEKKYVPALMEHFGYLGKQLPQYHAWLRHEVQRVQSWLELDSTKTTWLEILTKFQTYFYMRPPLTHAQARVSALLELFGLIEYNPEQKTYYRISRKGQIWIAKNFPSSIKKEC